MSKTIFCQKLQRESAALDQAPYPGELGQRLLTHISKEAWEQWLGQQTMLINEYRLSLIDPKARAFLQAEMRQFLFNDSPPASDSDKTQGDTIL